MQVTINNKGYELQPETTLDKVSAIIGLQSTSGIALAVNNAVIPRLEWESYHLQANDTVLVIRAIQGG